MHLNAWQNLFWTVAILIWQCDGRPPVQWGGSYFNRNFTKRIIEIHRCILLSAICIYLQVNSVGIYDLPHVGSAAARIMELVCFLIILIYWKCQCETANQWAETHTHKMSHSIACSRSGGRFSMNVNILRMSLKPQTQWQFIDNCWLHYCLSLRETFPPRLRLLPYAIRPWLRYMAINVDSPFPR